MKTKIARYLLWFAVIWWGVWFGGQLFNALMVVPFFSSNPPESLAEWGRMRVYNVADFFIVFNTFWITLALAASYLFGRKTHGKADFWIILSAAAALVSLILLMGWMVPTISLLVLSPDRPTDPNEVARLLKMWTILNWIRLLIELFGFTFALRALSLSNEKIYE
jgi:hypothetical protein